MNSNVIQLDSIRDNEMMNLQPQILEYASSTYGEELQDIVEDFIGDEYLSEDEVQLVGFLLLVWGVFTLEVYPGETVIQKFIEKKRKDQSLRASTLKQLEDWEETVASFSRITKLIDDLHLQVEDIFTGEKKNVMLSEKHETLEEGGMLLGFLVPQSNHFTYFTMYLDFPANETETLINDIKNDIDESDLEDVCQYMKNAYPTLLLEIITGEIGEGPNVNQINWGNPKHEAVATLFKEEMELTLIPEEFVDMGVMLWFLYCQKENPKIQKPAVYAAALHYFIDMNMPGLGIYTQGELAETYGVSSGSVSKAYRSLEKGLEEELVKMDEFLDHTSPFEDDENIFYEEDFEDTDTPFNRMGMERSLRDTQRLLEGKEFETPEEINEFLNQQLNDIILNAPQAAKDKAQEIIYNAYDTQGKKRVQLAKEALKIDPNCADAYNILGDEERILEKKIYFYKKGMEVGEKELGKKIFQEDKGMFWGLVETRPFMRTKYNYAYMLKESGNLKDALQHFEELLELNETDNQGVRYTLFSTYVEMKQYKKANELLNQYPDNFTANGTYNQVLIEYLLNRISHKLGKLLKHAKKTNPYVMEYLIEKKPLPNTQPATYQLGDKREAAIYASSFFSLWKDHKELIKYVKEF